MRRIASFRSSGETSARKPKAEWRLASIDSSVVINKVLGSYPHPVWEPDFNSHRNLALVGPRSTRMRGLHEVDHTLFWC